MYKPEKILTKIRVDLYSRAKIQAFTTESLALPYKSTLIFKDFFLA